MYFCDTHNIKEEVNMDVTNTFELDTLLTEEEARELFSSDSGNLSQVPQNDQDGGEEKDPDESEIENDGAEVDKQPESVGKKNNEGREDADVDDDKGSSSPDVFYSSIARAAKNDGIFSNLDDEFIEKIKGAEDFGEAMEKEVNARLDEKQRRINEARGLGASSEEIRLSENTKSTLDYLKGLSNADIEDESDAGEDLRKTILYNDFIARGFTQERAQREIKKSFDAGTDVEDAKEALESLTSNYENRYNNIVSGMKRRHDEYAEQQRKNTEKYRKMVLDEEIALGDQKLSKAVRQKIYDATQKPVYKDPETGKFLTEIQKFQKENPLEFLKQLGMWFVLTEGGKNMTGFTKEKVKSEKHKAMRELENKIVAGSFNEDGSLRFAGDNSNDGEQDILLSDDWKIGTGL